MVVILLSNLILIFVFNLCFIEVFSRKRQNTGSSFPPHPTYGIGESIESEENESNIPPFPNTPVSASGIDATHASKSESLDNPEYIKKTFGNDISQVDKDIIFEGLKKLYVKKIMPLEIASKYSYFQSSPLRSSDFDAKPMVLILGQYSVGKTSFIRSLLKQDFPGQRIGPEPTTDRFTAIMHSTDGQSSGRLSPGHALVMQPDKPQNAVVRRINELVKRARSVKVHAYIIHYLRKQMPYLVGKSEKQESLLKRLDAEFISCARRYNLPLGDFPNVDHYRKVLRETRDISAFKKLDKSLVYEMDKVLTVDIPLLLQKATRSQGSSPSSQLSDQSDFDHHEPQQLQQYFQQNQQYQQQQQHYHPRNYPPGR